MRQYLVDQRDAKSLLWRYSIDESICHVKHLTSLASTGWHICYVSMIVHSFALYLVYKSCTKSAAVFYLVTKQV